MQLSSQSSFYEQFRSILKTHSNKISSLQFSERFFRLSSAASIMVPAMESLSIYEEIKQRLTVSLTPTEPYDKTFVESGIAHLKKVISSKNLYTYLTPYSAYFLRKHLDAMNITRPQWLPEVFKTNSLDGQHAYTYLFNWSTVRAEHLCSRYIGVLVDAAYNEALGRQTPKEAESDIAATTEKTTSVRSFAELHKLNTKTKPDSTASVSAENKPDPQASATTVDVNAKSAQVVQLKETPVPAEKPSLPQPSEAVQRSMYIAKKYLLMQRGAADRGLSFTLTLDDMANLLRSNRCHYTGCELVSFSREALDKPASVPDNYLTIDRVDNNIGYEVGNVVVCAKSINELKDQMSKEEFDQAIAIQKMLKTSGVSLSQKQLAIMSASL